MPSDPTLCGINTQRLNLKVKKRSDSQQLNSWFDVCNSKIDNMFMYYFDQQHEMEGLQLELDKIILEYR